MDTVQTFIIFLLTLFIEPAIFNTDTVYLIDMSET